MDKKEARIIVLQDLRKTMAKNRFGKFKEPEKAEETTKSKKPSIAIRLMQLEGK
jgi:hypothetical protein